MKSDEVIQAENRDAFQALDSAKTREEKRAIIDKLGGLPVDLFRGWPGREPSRYFPII